MLLDAAERAAGFLEDLATNHTDQLARSAICPSHYMAVIELYRATGNDAYLRLAEAFVAVRDGFEGGDDNQDRVRVLDQTRGRTRCPRQLPVRRTGGPRRRDG